MLTSHVMVWQYVKSNLHEISSLKSDFQVLLSKDIVGQVWSKACLAVLAGPVQTSNFSCTKFNYLFSR